MKPAAAIAKKSVGAYRKIPVVDIDPNPWNPNQLTKEQLAKLARGVKEVREKTGSVPPIVVRPHPSDTARFQIIDGEHRWRIYKDHSIDKEIDAIVLNVTDELAQRLTLNLNYLRGEPDEAKEASILASLSKEGWSPAELSETLYLEEQEIIDRLIAYKENDALAEILKNEGGDGGGGGEEDVEDSVFVDLEFRVSVAQAKVIERELKRLESKLKGKNSRGRALEVMAVHSSQTEFE